MKKIHIVTDSSCDLTNEECGKLGIHVVPLTIQMDGKSYIDGVDVKRETFLDLLKTAKNFPKSSQPAPGQFKEMYEKIAQQGDIIISIHVASALSGTLESARQGAEMTNIDVITVDSKFIALALGIQVREAAKMRNEGRTVDEIIDRLTHIQKNTKFYVFLDTLENLLRSGRIGKGKSVIGSLLNIKPIAILENGQYIPVSKVRSHKKAIQYLFKQFVEDTKGKIVQAIGFSHANGMEPIGNQLKEKLESLGFQIEVKITSPVISTHTGDGGLGFIYFAE